MCDCSCVVLSSSIVEPSLIYCYFVWHSKGIKKGPVFISLTCSCNSLIDYYGCVGVWSKTVCLEQDSVARNLCKRRDRDTRIAFGSKRSFIACACSISQ